MISARMASTNRIGWMMAPPAIAITSSTTPRMSHSMRSSFRCETAATGLPARADSGIRYVGRGLDLDEHPRVQEGADPIHRGHRADVAEHLPVRAAEVLPARDVSDEQP